MINCQRATGSLAQAGCGSSDTVCGTSSFALVRAFAMPPPDAKLPLRCAPAGDTTVQKCFGELLLGAT